MSKKKIFISHTSIETELAQFLKEIIYDHFLGMLDIFVSSDHESIEIGEKWLSQVETFLGTADICLVLCSNKSVSRPWVNFEAGAAWLRKIPVIPICHSDLAIHQLPSPLSMLQGISGNEEGIKKLYDKIADTLQVRLPKVDFKDISEKFKEIETQYLLKKTAIPVIEKPKILCAASKQYSTSAMEFDKDVSILNTYFPGCVTADHEITQNGLIKYLTTEKFDIVHLVLFVDKTTGELVFSHVDSFDPEGSEKPKQSMSAAGFASLLVESNVKLIVLSTCNSLLLAVEVNKFANMVSSDTELLAREAVEWADCFYSMLADGIDLYKSFELTKKQLPTIPIRTIGRNNFIFSLDKS